MQAGNVEDENVTSIFNNFSSSATHLPSQQLPMAAIFVGLVVVICHVIFGTTGNLMVIVAIRQSSRLQSKSHYLIGSLAIADLLVSVLVVPLAFITIYFGKFPTQAWATNHIFCGVFVFFDVTCCTVSILHLCAIAWARYRSITNAVAELSTTVRIKSVLPLVTILWTLASVLSITPLLIFGSMTNEDPADGSTEGPETTGISCAVNINKIYRVVATMIAFYLPLLVILIIYIMMARIAWSKVRKTGFQISERRPRGRTYLLSTARRKLSRLFSKPRPDRPAEHASPLCSKTNAKEQNSEHLDDRVALTSELSSSTCIASSAERNSEGVTANPLSTLARTHRRSVTVMKRERKILLTLGMIIGAFIACWLPFFIKEIVAPFCDSCEISFLGETIINWLGYLNSLLNPIIYAYTNKEFNDAFRKMWCMKK